MTTFTQDQKAAIAEEMADQGYSPAQITRLLAALPLGSGGTVRVSQVIDTVEAGSVVVGYTANRIG